MKIIRGIGLFALLLIGTADLSEGRIFRAGKTLITGGNVVTSGAVIAGPVQAPNGSGCDVLLLDTSIQLKVTFVRFDRRRDCRRIQRRVVVGSRIEVFDGLPAVEFGSPVVVASSFDIDRKGDPSLRDFLRIETVRQCIMGVALRDSLQTAKHFRLDVDELEDVLPGVSELVEELGGGS